MGVVWLVTSRARLSLLSLGALDVLAFTVAGVFTESRATPATRPPVQGCRSARY
jgi:hypothetical protein